MLPVARASGPSTARSRDTDLRSAPGVMLSTSASRSVRRGCGACIASNPRSLRWLALGTSTMPPSWATARTLPSTQTSLTTSSVSLPWCLSLGRFPPDSTSPPIDDLPAQAAICALLDRSPDLCWWKWPQQRMGSGKRPNRRNPLDQACTPRAECRSWVRLVAALGNHVRSRLQDVWHRKLGGGAHPSPCSQLPSVSSCHGSSEHRLCRHLEVSQIRLRSLTQGSAIECRVGEGVSMAAVVAGMRSQK